MTSDSRPELLYLPAIFRDVRSGKIRAPAFQRGFVWSQTQVLNLLDSVYRKYPIGSLLFWRTDIGEMTTDVGYNLPFPHPSVEGEVDFLLDGMQRLSSLFGALSEPVDGQNIDVFNVVFDLEEESFLPAEIGNERCVSLRNVFNPRKLLEEQARLIDLSGGQSLVDRTVELQQAFQEYLVPVIRTGRRPTDEIVEIFERVNSTGTKLDAVDFMRALTWSSNFDLSQRIESLGEITALQPFNIPPNTIAKCIALLAGVTPTSDDMLRLREATELELEEAVSTTALALERSGEYLANELGVLSYDFVPYEGQLLVIVAVAAATESGEPLPSWVKRWFWSVAFSESLQGRPDHVIASIAVAAGSTAFQEGLEHRLELTEELLWQRKVRKGAALSMATVAAIAQRPARSLFTGEIIPSEQFVRGYDRSQIAPVFSKDRIRDSIDPSPRSELICNLILVEEGRRRGANPTNIHQAILDLAAQDDWQTLESQCINRECVDALIACDVECFLRARARFIITIALGLSC